MPKESVLLLNTLYEATYGLSSQPFLLNQYLHKIRKDKRLMRIVMRIIIVVIHDHFINIQISQVRCSLKYMDCPVKEPRIASMWSIPTLSLNRIIINRRASFIELYRLRGASHCCTFCRDVFHNYGTSPNYAVITHSFSLNNLHPSSELYCVTNVGNP